MKIAVAYFDEEHTFPAFGYTEAFKIYEVQDGAVVKSNVIGAGSYQKAEAIRLLTTLQVEVLICDGIGKGMKKKAENAGLQVFGGVKGSADAAVEAWLQGTLVYDPDPKCPHKGEGGGCNGGGCGGSCGGGCH